MKKSKMMFITTLLLSSMMIMSSENWISIWMSLEINMMSFIPLMSEKKNKKAPESKMIYFLIQSISSIMMILMIIINPMMSMNSMLMQEMAKKIMMMSIMMKMGSAPLHMWFINIMSKMNWQNCMILMTWQKLAPMMMLTYIVNENMIMLFIMMSTIIGTIGGINQTSIQKMMAYSSINHMSWMMMCIKMESDLWIKYWIIYSIMIIMITKTLKHYNIYHINQMMMLTKTNTEKINLIIMMMSLGGMPPFIGFLPKWMTIQSSIKTEKIIIITMMTMMSMITLYYYMRMMSPIIMLNNSKNKWMIKTKKNSMNKILLMLNISMPIVMTINMI